MYLNFIIIYIEVNKYMSISLWVPIHGCECIVCQCEATSYTYIYDATEKTGKLNT